MRRTFEQKLNNVIHNAKNINDDFFTMDSAKFYGLTEKMLDKNAEKFGLRKVFREGYNWTRSGEMVKYTEIAYKF